MLSSFYFARSQGNIAFAFAFALLTTMPVEAQVLFNTATPNGEQLRQINANGTGNTSLQIGNLPQEANPALSNDGRFLSVRSSDPNRPNQFSTNVHVFDSANGQLRKITDFEDSTDPQTGNTFNHSPRYTAFSPDGSMLAVSDFLNIQTNAQGSSTTNFTSIYRVSDGALLVGPAINATASTSSTVGIGISWSAASNRVAIPTNAPNGMSAIFSGNGLLNIPVQQETFPQGGIFNGGNFFEDDSFPTYSPNGQAMAYFRSRDFLTGSGALPSQLSLRIKSPAGDRSIFTFNQGFQPTGISWSPDGTQLAVGIGQQVSGGGLLFNLANPAASRDHSPQQRRNRHPPARNGFGFFSSMVYLATEWSARRFRQRLRCRWPGLSLLATRQFSQPRQRCRPDDNGKNNFGNGSLSQTLVPASNAVPEPATWGPSPTRRPHSNYAAGQASELAASKTFVFFVVPPSTTAATCKSPATVYRVALP